MSISSIQNSDNRAQNNIMAAYTGICAGAAGTLAGYNFAPRAAKNMDELLNLNQDVFCRTIDNIQNSESLEALSKSWAIIPAKATYDSIEIRLNNAFPGDKITVKDFNKQLEKQEKQIKEAGKKIDNFISDMTKKKGTNLSLEEYFNEIAKRDILPENVINIVKESIANTIGENGLKEPNPINDSTIDMFKSSKEIALNITKKELKLYKNLAKVEKNGILLKKDMIESAQKDIKPIIDSILTNVSFNDIKRFIPKVGQTKWALITGGASALITAAGVKLFGNNKN